MRKALEGRQTLMTACAKRLGLGAFTLVLVMIMGFCLDYFTFISNAQGKITASAARIRKEADANSEVLGSVAQGDTITINSEVTGSDGNIWYQVNVNSSTVGYIRSDLVEKTDGSLQTGNGESGGASGEGGSPAPTVEVSPVQPVGAKVASEQVRVRVDANSDGGIVATVGNDVALTVTGQATGTDGRTWYQVTFISDGAEVSGFVRSDFVTLEGELLPADATAPPEGAGDAEAPSGGEGEGNTSPADGDKAFETMLDGEEWYLIDKEGNVKYQIEKLILAATENAKSYEASLNTIKGQKIAIIIMIVVIVVLALAVSFLIFKIKDTMDEAYFSAVEKETIRERSTGKGQSGRPKGSGAGPGSGKRVMQTVGAEQDRPGQPRPGIAPAKPGQAKPGAVQPKPGQVKGAQPKTVPQPGQMSPQSQKPQGQRGGQRAQARPAGPQGQRSPAQKPPVNQSRTGAPQGQMPQGAAAGQPRHQAGQQVPRTQQQNQGWKSRNFMNDEDDEFEFEFLNWDGDENP